MSRQLAMNLEGAEELMGELEGRIIWELKELEVPPMDFEKTQANRSHLWLYVSGFQKACRRGHTEIAWECADKMWQLGRSNHLMKRLATVSGEDIGLGCPKTAIKILVGWKNRAEITAAHDGDESWIWWLIRKACECKKNRLGDHLNLWRHVHPKYEEWQTALSKIRIPSVWCEGVNDPNLTKAENAIRRSMGFRKWAGQLETGEPKKTFGGQPRQLLLWLDRRKDMSNWLKLACKIQVDKGLSPHWTNILAAKDAGIDLSGLEDGSGIGVPDSPPDMLAPGVPEYALDKHTGEGKRVMGYLRKKYPGVDFGNLIFIQEGTALGVERTNAELRNLEHYLIGQYIERGMLRPDHYIEWSEGIEADLKIARRKIMGLE